MKNKRNNKKSLTKEEMNTESKKGLGPLIMILGLFIVALVSVFFLQDWFDGYLQGVEVDIEKSTTDVPVIKELKNDNLFLYNPDENDLEIASIEISKIDCDVQSNLPKGISSVNVSLCLRNLTTGKHEIVIVSDKGVLVAYKYLKIKEYGSGDSGPVDDPYLIGDNPYGDGCEELQNMSQDMNGDYTLIDDVFCGNTSTWNGGNGFDPVGNNSDKFTGTFDGNGYVIYDLYINHDNKNTGLFGNINGATISNFTIEVNLIAGDKKDIGGVAGVAENSVIHNVHIRGDITGNRKEAGGLVGTLSSSTIRKSSYAEGTVTGDRKSVGGLVGIAANSNIEDSYSRGTVTGNKDYMGGLVGDLQSSTITNTYSTGAVTASSGTAGGLVGRSASSTVTSSYWDTTSSGVGTSAEGTGQTTSQMQTQSTFTGWDFSSIWSINEGSDYPQLR